MALTFADTHNMIAYLNKLDANEGFDKIIDLLNASAIKYALTVNPNIYVSCNKQFWSSVSVKKVNDVTRLQALIDRKKVIITEATVREALRLDDAESIDCLPNEELFIELSRMGYEKPSTKLTFYKAFFSAQWKFFIHTILQCMSAKRTSWNEFSSSMASPVICLSTEHVGDLSSHTTKYSSPALTQKVFANMRRVGKGYSGVETPLFEGMIVAQQADDVADEVASGVDVADVPAADVEPTLSSPTPTTQPPPPSQELPSISHVIPTPPPSLIAQPSSPPSTLYYEIYTENNKPYYKIIRADGSHQLFLSFLRLLRNFDREDLEVQWQLVKERFASSKPKNFLDDFLLTTLREMFEKPDVQAQIWKNQRSVHGLAKVKSWRLLESCGVHIITFTTTQMILLVERRYPLTKFTLDQMLNNVRLEVEKESEVSLDVLSFGVDAAEDFKENTLRDYYCWLKTYCCSCNLKLLDDVADIKL
nr:hypothetical protein [Tanacetum cinerariifolium]